MNKIVILVSLSFICTLPLLAQSANSDDWKGFYVGGNGFVSNDKSNASASLSIQQTTNVFIAGRGIVVVPGTTLNFSASKRKTNGGGGGQAGYQWQAGKFVFGAEGDFNPFRRTASVSQSQQLPVTIVSPVTTVTAKRDARISQEFSLRARGGVAFGNTLVYGTGGYSNARVRVTNIDSYTNPGGLAALCVANCTSTFNSGPSGPIVTTASQSKNMSGWNVGGGIEQKFGKLLSIGFEYRHTDLRSKTFAPTNAVVVNTGSSVAGTNGVIPDTQGQVSSGPTRISLKSDSFGVRVNFHF